MTAYVDLLIDSDGDLYIEDGDFCLTESSGESLRQRLDTRFNTWQGEWDYNTGFGTPYKQTLLAGQVTKAEADAIFTAQISLEDDVTSISDVDSTWDKTTRAYTINSITAYVDDEELDLSLASPYESDPYTYPEPTDTTDEDFSICVNAYIKNVSLSWGSTLTSEEAAEDGTVTVTSGNVEDGQEATVTLNSIEYTSTVEDNVAEFTIPSEDLSALTGDTTYYVTAYVIDADGNDDTLDVSFYVESSASLFANIGDIILSGEDYLTDSEGDYVADLLDADGSEVDESLYPTLHSLLGSIGVIETISLPTTLARGGCFDGTWIWVSTGDDSLIKISPDDYSYTEYSISMAGYAQDCVVVGDYIYVVDDQSNLYIYDTETVTKQSTEYSVTSNVVALTYDGTYFYTFDSDTNLIYKYDSDITLIESYSNPLDGTITEFDFYDGSLWGLYSSTAFRLSSDFSEYSDTVPLSSGTWFAFNTDDLYYNGNTTEMFVYGISDTRYLENLTDPSGSPVGYKYVADYTGGA